MLFAHIYCELEQLVRALDLFGGHDQANLHLELLELLEVELAALLLGLLLLLLLLWRLGFCLWLLFLFLRGRFELGEQHIGDADLLSFAQSSPLQRGEATRGLVDAKGIEDLARGVRQHRREQERDPTNALERVVEHLAKALFLRLVLGQFPGLVALDVLVELGGERERDLERSVELARLEGVLDLSPGLLRDLDKQLVILGQLASGGRFPVGEALHHLDHAIDEVAKVIRQLRVVALDQPVTHEVAVVAKRNLAKQVVANHIERELLDQLVRVDPVPGALAHLLALDEPPAVHEQLLGRLQTCAHQERWPEDAVEAKDVLAEQVQRAGPELLERLVILSERTHARDVVGERVDPHIHDVLRVVRDRDTPVERRAADGEVLQATFDKRDYLVVARLGADTVRVALVPGEQLVLVGAQLEEVGRLRDPLDGRAALYGLAILDLVLGVERLVRGGVPPLVGVEVDVAALLHRLEDPRRHARVILVRGADEAVVRELESIEEVEELLGVLVRELFRGLPCLLRLALDLESVLVGARHEEDLVTTHTVIARQNIGHDRRVRVPDVW